MTILFLLLACSLKPRDPSGGVPSDDSSPPDDSSTPDDSATTTDSEKASICPSGIAADDVPVMWTTTDSALSFVDGTGTAREVFPYENPGPEFATAQVAGDRIGVVAVDYYEGAELGLLEADGALVSRELIPDGYQSDFWVGDGYLAYSPGYEGFDAQNPWMDGVVLGSAGASSLDGWIPKGPVVDGVLPVCAVDDSSCAWLDLSTVAVSGSLSIDAWWTGAHLVWTDGTDLVVATPAAEQRIDIGASAVLAWTPDAVLIGTAAAPLGIAWLETGAVVPVGPLPDGWRAFTDPDPDQYCPNDDWSLTADGRVLAVLRNDQEAQVWVHDPATGSWEPIGFPLADVIFVGVWERSGTVEIRTVSPGETFCIWPTFEPTASVLLGSTVQVVRATDGIHWVNPSWAVRDWVGALQPIAFDAGGTCALSTAEDAVVDVLTGDAVALAATVGGWLE